MPNHERSQSMRNPKNSGAEAVFRVSADTILILGVIIIIPILIVVIVDRRHDSSWLLLLAAFFLEFLLCGVVRNLRLVADQYGLRHYNAFGQLTFDCAWADLEKFGRFTERTENRPTGTYISGNGQTIDVSQIRNLEGIAALIRTHAPQAKIGELNA